MTPQELHNDHRSVRRIARTIVPAHMLDDAISEGIMALLEAREKGVAPRIVVKRRIIDYYRACTKSRTINPPKFVSIDNAGQFASAPLSTFEQDPGFIPLNKMQQRALNLRARGLSNQRIADTLGIANGSARRLIMEIRRRLGLSKNPGGGNIEMLKAAREQGHLRDELTDSIVGLARRVAAIERQLDSMPKDSFPFRATN